MARPKSITLSPTATDADGIAQSQTPAAGGVQSLTINGALASGGTVTFSQPQHVTITSVADESARTFTVTGTDRYAAPLTEEITGANAGVAVGAANFATVTGITTDNDTTGAVTAGVNGTCESQWVILNYRNSTVGTHFSGELSSGATMTFMVQHTLNDPFDPAFSETSATAFDGASATANQLGTHTLPVTAIRLRITAYTSGTVTFRIVQVGSDK